MPQPPTMVTPEYRDYSDRLIGLGACQILLGCGCGLLAAFAGALRLIPLGAQAQKAGATVGLQMVAFYFAWAVAFIWLGKGMIAARRWAWTLTVVTSWIWLIFGSRAFIDVEFVGGPQTWAYLKAHGMMATQTVGGMRLFAGVFLGVGYIGVPGLLLLFSHHDSVRATCVRRDPRASWTDRCPMPVFALVVLFVISFDSLLSMAARGLVFPIFGTYVAGWAGALAIALTAVILAGLAWGLYRLQMAAWWGTLLFGIAYALNTATTFARADLVEMYRLQGISANLLEMFNEKEWLDRTSRWELWTGVVGGIAWVAYLIAVRRYFLKSGAPGSAKT